MSFFIFFSHLDFYLGARGVGGDGVNAARVSSTAVPGLHLVPLRVPLPQQDGLVQGRRQQQGGQAVCTGTGRGFHEGGETSGAPPALTIISITHLFLTRRRLSPRLCVRPPSSPPCPPWTRSWPFCRRSRLGSYGNVQSGISGFNLRGRGGRQSLLKAVTIQRQRLWS